MDIEWSQNNTILIPNAVESTSTPSNVAIDNLNMHFDASQIGLEYDLNQGGSTNEFDIITHADNHIGRRKRSTRFGRMYNPYVQQVTEQEQDFSMAPTARHIRSRRGLFDSHEHILNNLPPNRTIHFDCVNAEEGACVQAKFTVFNFKTGNVPIFLTFNFSIDLNIIGEYFLNHLLINQPTSVINTNINVTVKFQIKLLRKIVISLLCKHQYN